jgi:hypothetical protein
VQFLDLDRFKVIDDTPGHLVGDHLLVVVGERVAECLRPGDTVARVALQTTRSFARRRPRALCASAPQPPVRAWFSRDATLTVWRTRPYTSGTSRILPAASSPSDSH